jgi:hypothetical protein
MHNKVPATSTPGVILSVVRRSRTQPKDPYSYIHLKLHPKTLCHPDRNVRFVFPPLPLRRPDAEWRDLLLASRHAFRFGRKACRP